ncbi:family 10 glycosylhydrolase [candidate division KSB1 bacterium]|nr:family 10 glycosylhydrolase [candidate division KSB1 bacterium]
MRMKRGLILFLSFFIGCATVKRPIPEPTPKPEITSELRGVWVTRFDWVRKDPQLMQTRIKEIMVALAEEKFNAVFFQIRGAAETLYPSPHEPWSKLLDAQDPGFDPLELAIQQAHKHGLTFYAYINLLPLYAGDTPPADSSHLYYKHGPNVAPDSSWVCFGADQKPMERNEYYYLNPALPQVRTYLKKVLRHVAETYDVDGLHFDRIRYPGADYLFDPYSLQTFRQDSLKLDIDRSEWARRMLTDLVEDVVAEAWLIKPYLHMSAATWGLYRTDDLPGYEQFRSGYANYYQDAIDWLDRGIMDFIVPMIYWDQPDPKPNFDELWADFHSRTDNYRHIIPGMIAKQPWLENGELAAQIETVRRNNGQGHVLFSYSALEKQPAFAKSVYESYLPLPDKLKRTHKEQVLALHVLSATAELGNFTGYGSMTLQHTDSKGWASLILSQLPDTLKFSLNQEPIHLPTRFWRPPFRYALTSNHHLTRMMPWVEWRISPDDTTTRSPFPLLGKTDSSAIALVEDTPAHVYNTGIFFKDIDLQTGANRIRTTVIGQDSQTVFYENEIVFQKPKGPRKPLPLWVDSTSIAPSVDMRLPATDRVPVEFTGSRGQQGFIWVQPGNIRLEMNRKDYEDFSRYSTDIDLAAFETSSPLSYSAGLQTPDSAQQLIIKMDNTITKNHAHTFNRVMTTTDQTVLSYNLGPIRLGGPILAELDSGVVLQSSGRVGGYTRVSLDQNTSGFIPSRELTTLDPKVPRPGYYLRSLSITPGENEDLVYIPYSEPVPYAVFPEPHLKRIRIVLYGVKTSSTWLTHRQGLQIIDHVDWQQPLPETYEILVNLKSHKIWGYHLEKRGQSLVLRVKTTPASLMQADSLTLQGLKIAIEAGHGGSNLGAIGLSGLQEKKINLDLAKRLEALCRQEGMQVFQVRPDDRDMSLTEKRRLIHASDADLCVSIHANAAGLSRGYLGVSGTSTYYHNAFWSPFAHAVYDRLLDLELEEFGVVGSFNYKVIRQSERPTILVEQAFMTHALDEEKLFSASFRQKMAQAVLEGIRNFIHSTMP